MKTNATQPRCAGSWKRNLLAALILLLCMSVMGCSARGTLRPSAQIPPELLELLRPLPSPDASLLTLCPLPVPALDDSLPTLLRHQQETGARDADCRSRHAGLAAQVRERERQEAERAHRATQALNEGLPP